MEIEDMEKAAGAKHALAEKLQYWVAMRDLISHEDNLVNHRFSWLLTYQGFLMGGFFLVQSAVADAKLTTPMILGSEGFLLLVMLCSMWICFITGQTISAAYRQVASVYHTWTRRYPEEDWPRCPLPHWFWPFAKARYADHQDSPPAGSDFPPLRGGFVYSSLGRTLRIPFILCFINFLAVLACLVVAWMAWRHGGAVYVKPHS